MFPIAFRATVLDADDGIFADELRVKIHEFRAGNSLAGAFLERISAVAVVKFGCGHVEREVNLLAQFVTGISHGFGHGIQRIFHTVELRRKTAFVTDGCGQAALFSKRISTHETFQ